MKRYPLVVVVFALFGAHASAGDRFQETCDVDYRLHENLSSILTNDVGQQIIDDLAQNIRKLCMDPAAHNALVDLMDAIVDVSTDMNVAQTLGNIFFWARKIIKNPNFRVAWNETMSGLNMLFDRQAVVSELADTFFDKFTALLNDPNFDSSFESVVKQLSVLLNMRKNVLYGAGALLVNPLGSKPNPNIQPQNANVKRQNSHGRRR